MWGLLLFLVAGESPEESQGAFHWKTDCEQLRRGHELYQCLAQLEDKDPKAQDCRLRGFPSHHNRSLKAVSPTPTSACILQVVW